VPDKEKNMVTYIMPPAREMMEAAAAVILLAELQELVRQSAKVPYTRQSDELAILVAERIHKLESEIPA
jgi:hypothetical protein